MAARTSRRPHAISKSMRLRRRPEFLAVQAHGRKVHGTAFLALVATNPSSQPTGRIGFTVTKRIGNAVTRNRIKRRTRDWLRQHGWAPPGLDVVLIAKEGAASLEGPALAGDLRRLFARIATC